MGAISVRGRAHGLSPHLIARIARNLGGFVLRLQPIVDVLAHHVFGQAIALLDLAFELVALAVDCGQIVVGELTPLFFDLPLGLFPISFDAILVHGQSSFAACASKKVWTRWRFRSREATGAGQRSATRTFSPCGGCRQGVLMLGRKAGYAT